MLKTLKVMISLDEYQCENEKKKLQQPDKISYICKDNFFTYIYIYVNRQTKTVPSMITKGR